MVIEPVTAEEDLFDFTEQIRSKLEKAGYKGKALADKIAEQKRVVDRAFTEIIREAEKEYHNGNTVSHEELFADLDGEA